VDTVGVNIGGAGRHPDDFPATHSNRVARHLRQVVVLVAVAGVLGACASAPAAPAFTYRPGESASTSQTSTSAEPTASESIASASAPAASAAVSPSEPVSQPSAAPSSGSTAEPVGAPPTGIAIYLSEWSVGLPTSMLAGQVKFAITNIGTIQHELLVFRSDLPAGSFPVDKNGNIIEDGPGINLVSDGDNIDPGKTQTRVVDLTQPGSYLFVCNIPGHFKSGMFRAVTVTTPAAEQAYVPAALSEWHVAVPSSIKAGTVNLEAANFGTIQHELLVFKSDLPPSSFPVDANGNIIEDGPGINLVSDGDNIDPGKTQTRKVDLTQPGAYLFVCNIPGHFKAGMFSTVTVTP
jgi:uncharacterized cupredoxin-like copper-binding protein